MQLILLCESIIYHICVKYPNKALSSITSRKTLIILSFILGSYALITPTNQSADADVNLTTIQQPPAQRRNPPAQREKPPATKPNLTPHPPYCEYPDSKMFIRPTTEPEKIAPGMIVPNALLPEEIAPGMIIPCPKSPDSKTTDTREIKR